MTAARLTAAFGRRKELPRENWIHRKRRQSGMLNTPEELSALRTMLKFAQKAQPVLSWLGIKEERINDLVQSCDNFLEIQKFNELFADRGWIAHRWLNMTAALDALNAGRAERWEDADQILIRAYDPETIGLYVKQLARLKCFERRLRLTLLAIDDYAAGRYHACIPVVLALLDGMGQELTGQGFLRQGVRFAGSHSFLEIGPGVTTLIKKMTDNRGRVNTDEIDMPYRHGILHGTDLGYDTQRVAAKAWGALLAVGSYATDSEIPPPPETPPKGLMDSLRDYAATRARIDDVTRHCEAWKPRSSSEIIEAARNGTVEPSTPEHAAVEVMKAWQKRNLGGMAALSVDSRKQSVKAVAGRIRENVGDPPAAFELLDVDDSAPAAAWVTLSAEWPNDDKDTIRLRLLHFVEDECMPRNMGSGSWLIHSFWPLEAASLRIAAIHASRR